MARVSLSDGILDEDEPPPRLESPEPAPPAPVEPPAAVEDEAPWKYTVMLSPADYDRARDVEDAAVKLAGVRRNRGKRAAVVRALFALAAEDPELLARVAARLRDGSPS